MPGRKLPGILIFKPSVIDCCEKRERGIGEIVEKGEKVTEFQGFVVVKSFLILYNALGL